MPRPAIAVILLCTLLASIAQAATYTVDNGGGGDYLTIQEGVIAASEGDTVLVMQGTYTGTGTSISGQRTSF
jgi:hypothetical protein